MLSAYNILLGKLIKMMALKKKFVFQEKYLGKRDQVYSGEGGSPWLLKVGYWNSQVSSLFFLPASSMCEKGKYNMTRNQRS